MGSVMSSPSGEFKKWHRELEMDAGDGQRIKILLEASFTDCMRALIYRAYSKNKKPR